jgi:hypothetical protein
VYVLKYGINLAGYQQGDWRWLWRYSFPVHKARQSAGLLKGSLYMGCDLILHIVERSPDVEVNEHKLNTQNERTYHVGTRTSVRSMLMARS